MHSGSDEVARLERRYLREVTGPMSYREALQAFEALWALAQTHDPDFPDAGDWMEDIAGDLELARVLNALPSDS